MTLSILLAFWGSLFATPDTSIHATIEAQAIVSDAGATPFWMRSLQYGSVPMENPGLILRAWNGKGYNLKKKYDWKYEVEATGWTGKQNDFWLTQAYVSGRRGKWELWAGRRKEVYGLGDTAMTSGFYAWSGNAVPMPKIQLGTRDYLNFSKGWLGVHMTYSHGWFDNQGPVINAYLHQKTLYGRFGKPNSFINIFAGINHQVTWGGELKQKTGGQFDYFPSSLNAYFYVVTLLKNRSILEVDPNTSSYDANNQYGNHLGSIDLAINIKPKWGNIMIYKQSAFETGRIAKLSTINDGLTGLSINLKNNQKLPINNLTIEYLYTANQGEYASSFSKILGLIDPHQIERENYFNNGSGRGWYYLNRGIGTPLILLDNNLYFINAVKSYFMSAKGKLKTNIFWKIKISNSYSSYSSAKGDFIIPDSYYKNQLSLSLKLMKILSSSSQISSEIGFDHGERLNNSIGLLINYKKTIR